MRHAAPQRLPADRRSFANGTVQRSRVVNLEAPGAEAHGRRKTTAARWLRRGSIACALALVLSLAKASGVLAFANPESFRALLAQLAGDPMLPLYVLAAFLAAGALLVSPWLVIAQVALLVPPAEAIPLALSGALLSAGAFYGLGRFAGASFAQRVVPERVQRAVDGAGLGAVIVVRAVPALPYTLVNLCAGAFRVPLGVYLLGTALGMSPGIVAFALVGDRVLAAMTHPSPRSVGLVIGVATLAAIGLVVARRRRR